MTHLAIARTCRALALAEVAGAAWLATETHWLLAALVACTAPGLLFVDALVRRAHHRERAEAQRAARLKRGEQVEPLVPCCSFWHNSDGQVHGPDCTRTAAARTPNVHDYRPGRLTWGRNIVVHHTHPDTGARVSGWGHDIQQGDHLLLGSEGCHGRYEITEIEHHRDPADMWAATIRPVLASLERTP